mmetsp:Transcript_22927/g.54125  ORF Transcript_22927/g.54125 Transcript_22927/m.54125 type:complete len:299 (-) Transcript_22927:566-1462(-)
MCSGGTCVLSPHHRKAYGERRLRRHRRIGQSVNRPSFGESSVSAQVEGLRTDVFACYYENCLGRWQAGTERSGCPGHHRRARRNFTAHTDSVFVPRALQHSVGARQAEREHARSEAGRNSARLHCHGARRVTALAVQHTVPHQQPLGSCQAGAARRGSARFLQPVPEPNSLGALQGDVPTGSRQQPLGLCQAPVRQPGGNLGHGGRGALLHRRSKACDGFRRPAEALLPTGALHGTLGHGEADWPKGSCQQNQRRLRGGFKVCRGCCRRSHLAHPRLQPAGRVNHRLVFGHPGHGHQP